MWVQSPPPVKKSTLAKLLRPKPGETICGKLCGEPLRVFLHFAGGRSWPCVGRGCHLCNREIARRYYAYYPVRNSKGVLGIMELTSQAESSLDHQMSPITQIARGLVWVSRAHGRRNMPCEIVWKDSENNGDSNPQTFSHCELQDMLMHIWDLPKFDQTVSVSKWLNTINEIIKLRVLNHENQNHFHRAGGPKPL